MVKIPIKHSSLYNKYNYISKNFKKPKNKKLLNKGNVWWNPLEMLQINQINKFYTNHRRRKENMKDQSALIWWKTREEMKQKSNRIFLNWIHSVLEWNVKGYPYQLHSHADMSRFFTREEAGLPEESPRVRLRSTKAQPTCNGRRGGRGDRWSLRLPVKLLLFFLFFFSANILKFSLVPAQNSIITVDANTDITMATILLGNLWRHRLMAPAFWPPNFNCIIKGAWWGLSSPSWSLEKDLTPVHVRNGIIFRSASWIFNLNLSCFPKARHFKKWKM